MKRKEERQGLHEPSIFPKNLANRVSSSDDQEVADVPEDIAQVRGSGFSFYISGHGDHFFLRTYACCSFLFSAQRAATLSRVGVVGNPEPTAPKVAASAPISAVSGEAESASAVFVDRNWSIEIDANQEDV